MCVALATAACRAWSAARDASRSGALDVVGERALDRGDVVGRAALRRRPRDQRLEQAAEVEQRFEAFPVRHERPPDHLGRLLSPAHPDVGAAVAAALDVDVAGLGEPVERVANAGPVDAEQGGELALGRQSLARHVLAERDRRDEALRDLLARVSELQRRERAAGFGRVRRAMTEWDISRPFFGP